MRDLALVLEMLNRCARRAIVQISHIRRDDDIDKSSCVEVVLSGKDYIMVYSFSLFFLDLHSRTRQRED